MCGICGIVSPGQEDQQDNRRLAHMLSSLIHRGPDEEGVFRASGVRLGVRRLRVIDLETGSQPIRTEDGALTVVFNGEIYNYKELRKDLEVHGHRFRTHSDTETILLGYRQWSEDVFDRLDGMFAIAIWDEPQARLTLARDRIGEKPLYWSEEIGRLIFASEIRALEFARTDSAEIDRTALARYLFYGYSPSPETVLVNVRKLRPAEILTYADGRVASRRFWSPPVAPRAGVRIGDQIEVLQTELLPAAVRSRLVSDVPLGAFLSGGIDSTVIVDNMVGAEASPRTFSIGFQDQTYDESEKARTVARRLGTYHTERILSETDLVGLLMDLDRLVDEPLADPSLLPTHLLSRMAREQVTVALSGDGGDELFGGYPTYLAHRWAGLWNGAGKLAAPLVRIAAGALPQSDANLSLDFRLEKFGAGLGHGTARRHALWMSHCSPAQIAALLPDLPARELQDLLLMPVFETLGGRRFETDLDLAMHLDLGMYLADGVLMKVDRASMACSLETRAPFLARAVVEHALRLPASLKVGWRTTKKPLRQILHQRYPKGIVRQPKKGFGIPVSRWLRTVARDSVEQVLRDLPVNASAVDRFWDAHQKRRHNFRMPLWALFIFGIWNRRRREPPLP